MSRITRLIALLFTSVTCASVLAGAEPECVPAWEAEVADFAVLNGRVEALTMFDDGSGPALYAAGQFTHAGDLEVNYIARWDGTEWSSVGVGVTSPQFFGISALEVFDDGTGPALYAGGSFEQAGGHPFRNVARWTGSEWQDVGSGNDFDPIEDFVAFNDGSGEKLYAASYGFSSGWIVSSWDGTEWTEALEDVGTIYDLHVHDDGSGPKLYAAGSFQGPPGVDALNIARWDGTSWESLGDLFYDSVYALESMTTPDGKSLLYAGGRSRFESGDAVSAVASWNGSEWTPLFDETTILNPSTGVRTLQVFDDGTGSALFVGGSFLLQGEAFITLGIAKWTGTQFERLGNGGVRAGDVRATLPASFDGHPALVFGGNFNDVNSTIPTNGEEIDSPNLAIWRGCTPAPCPGDVSGDDTVDLADLNLVLANFGQQTDSGDTNGDGVVDLADLNAVLGAFGTDCE
mgnify:CR=1 FL=1